MLLECRSLDVFVDSRCLLRKLDLHVDAGRVLAVLGPNGAGKTLLLHTLAGLRPPAAGEVTIRGVPVGRWRKRDLAQQLALLPQNIEDPFPATVLETVLLGRHPHIARWRWESPEDLRIAREAIAAVDLAGYEQRDVFTLSGGERRRAALAMILAQAPGIFLMDEPTNHLDPNHQIEALGLLRARADAGSAVIVTLHDANLAVRFADEVLMLGSGGTWAIGATRQILTAPRLSELYSTRFAAIEHEGHRVFFQD